VCKPLVRGLANHQERILDFVAWDKVRDRHKAITGLEICHPAMQQAEKTASSPAKVMSMIFPVTSWVHQTTQKAV